MSATDHNLRLTDRLGAWLLTGPVGRALAFGIDFGAALGSAARRLLSDRRRP